jgi:hypothetical protein
MDADDIVTLVFFAIFFIIPVLSGLFRKKKGPLPKTKEDFEKRYQVKTEQAKKREHLKPPLVQPPTQVAPKKSTPSPPKTSPNKKESFSSSYKPGYSLESEISQRHIESKVKERHVESGLEELGYSDLLQDRFTDDTITHVKRPSYVRNLLKKSNLKEAVILSEILKRPY